MLLIFTSRLNPSPQIFFLAQCQSAWKIRRRHHLLRIQRLDSPQDFTFFRFATNNWNLAGFGGPRGLIHSIQSQSRFALQIIRTMARETRVGQHGANISTEIDYSRGSKSVNTPEAQREHENRSEKFPPKKSSSAPSHGLTDQQHFE